MPYRAQAQAISLHLTNVTAKKALLELKKQAAISIVAPSGLMRSNKRVDVNVRNASLSTVVKQILAGSDKYDFEIRGRIVIIKKASKAKKYRTPPTKKNVKQLDDVIAERQIVYPKSLDEIIVIAYGNAKKTDLTGAISSVDVSQTNKRSPVSVTDMIQGEVAGVVVNNYDASPGNNSTVLIRGYSTINNSTGPLYVVDGVQIGEDVSFINPEDIESIEVLKDASSSAIYGARGANGVILIKTKEGGRGKTITRFKAEYGVSTYSNRMNVLSADDYARALRIAKSNDGDDLMMPIWGESFDGSRKNIDWQKEIISNAPYSKYYGSVSGGNAKLHGMVSIGYTELNGLVIGTGYARTNFHATFSSQLTKRLSFSGYADYSHSSQGSGTGKSINYATLPPTMDYTDAEGRLISPNVVNSDNSFGTFWQYSGQSELGSRGLDNLYAEKKENHDRLVDDMLWAHVNLNYDFAPHFKFNSVLSYSIRNSDYNYYNDTRERYNETYDDDGLLALRKVDVVGLDTYNSLRLVKENAYDWDAENYFTYTFKNHVHHLTVMGGNSIVKSKGSYLSSYAKDISDYDVDQTNHPSSKQALGKFNTSQRFFSYYLRMMYQYRDRYNFMFSFRKDGSSNLTKRHRWGYFPSLGSSWRITEEPFMGNLGNYFYAKLRLGWGTIGNAGNLSDLNVKQLSSDNIDYKFYTNNGQNQSELKEIGTAVTIPVDENLKWEKNHQLNIGLDLQLFHPYLSLTMDYYIKTTSNLLVQQSIRPSSGFVQLYTNAGRIRNKGLEISSELRLKFGEASLRINGQAMFLHNNIYGLSNDIFGVESFNSGMHWDKIIIFRNGYPLGTWYGYKTDGLFKTQAEINEAKQYALEHGQKYYQEYAEVGDIRFKDTNHDGTINDGDMVPLGDSNPKMSFGLNLDVTWRRWNFFVHSYGALGVHKLSYTAMRLSLMSASDTYIPNLLKSEYAKTWSASNPNGTLPRLTIQDKNWNMRCSDIWIRRCDYLRIDYIQLRYNFSAWLCRALRVKTLGVYFAVDNPLLLTPYKFGNPEENGNALQLGVDGGKYPSRRCFKIGCEITI